MLNIRTSGPDKRFENVYQDLFALRLPQESTLHPPRTPATRGMAF
jgi:hypothetical protein